MTDIENSLDNVEELPDCDLIYWLCHFAKIKNGTNLGGYSKVEAEILRRMK